jgi:hypothetical protein
VEKATEWKKVDEKKIAKKVKKPSWTSGWFHFRLTPVFFDILECIIMSKPQTGNTKGNGIKYRGGDKKSAITFIELLQSVPGIVTFMN